MHRLGAPVFALGESCACLLHSAPGWGIWRALLPSWNQQRMLAAPWMWHSSTRSPGAAPRREEELGLEPGLEHH